MTPEQLKEIKESLKDTVVQTVNGKINLLSSKLDNYIAEDNEWKAEVMPTIEQTKKIMDFASFGGTILRAIVLIGSAATVVWGLIRFSESMKK